LVCVRDKVESGEKCVWMITLVIMFWSSMGLTLD
jgi:hypothetical protein